MPDSFFFFFFGGGGGFRACSSVLDLGSLRELTGRGIYGCSYLDPTKPSCLGFPVMICFSGSLRWVSWGPGMSRVPAKSNYHLPMRHLLRNNPYCTPKP